MIDVNPFDKYGKKNSNVASSTKELVSELQNGIESEQDINFNDEKPDFLQSHRESGKVPLLYIDVNLGNKNERITIYGGDDPEVIAKEFCAEHGKSFYTNLKLRT